MISSILILILHVYHINSVFINYTARCPGDNLERTLRATALCSTIEEYHCLYDEDFRLAEICQNYKQLPKGNFPRYSSFGDDIYYDPCPETRYQHGPAKSFQITDCLFEKSKCVSEGQKLCTTGTASTDSTCRCDYKNGYAMIGGKCCSPTSSEDCTCFRKDCPDENQELDPDYNCVNKCASGFDRKEEDFHCTIKLHTSIATETISPTTPAFEDGDFILEIPHSGSAKIILYVGLGLYLLHILCISIYGCYNGIWRPFRYKLIPYVVWCSITIACLIPGLHFMSERKIVAIILSVFLVLLICLLCLLGHIMSTHQIRKERKVYNEEYDVRIFRLLMGASKIGDMDTLRRLKSEQYIDMEDTDYDKRSALHLAAVIGNVDAVDFLLKNHFCFPDAHDRWERSVLDDIKWHRENKDCSENLKKVYEEIEGKLKKYKKSSVQKDEKKYFREIKALELIKAAEKGDLVTVKRLKNLGTEMNLSNSMGRTALHAAAKNGMEDIVKYLLNDCEVSSFVRMNDQRPIDVVPSDEKEVNNRIRVLLQKDMDEALTKEVKEMEPLDDDLKIVRLLNAASRGDIKQMKSYYKADYDMTAADYDNRTALHIAVSDNQDHIIRFLLDVCKLHDIAKEGKDRWDTTPLSASREEGRESVHDVFLELCPELVDTENDQYRTYLLLNAGANNDVHTLRRLCEKKVDMDLRDYDGRTALHLAAAENKLEAVQYLVETAKVKISIPDRENRKPLDEAGTYQKKGLTDSEKKDNKKIIDILEKAKGKKQPQCELPKAEQIKVMVMQAAAIGDLDTLKHKQFKNVSMDSSCDCFKNTPLHACAAKAKMNIVEYLIKERKVSPFVRNSFWKTPLQLVQEKIDFWGKRETSRQEDFKAIKKVLKEAMNSSSIGKGEVDDNFEKHKNDEKAKIFLFLNKAYKGDVKAVGRYLKTDQELLNKHDYDKRTALHLAAAEGHIDLVNFIVDYKDEPVNKHMEDRWGTTPLDEAKKKGDKEIINILEKS